MTQVRLHYWAGARAAAGVEEDTVTASTIAEALAAAAAARTDQRFAKILSGCTLLLDGRALHPSDLEQPLGDAVDELIVEILPPFAGG